MSEYKDMFVEEAREHLQTLNQTLVDFEEDPKNADALNQIFRAAHTLKGMAAAMNYDKIQKLSHKTEDTLDLVRNNQIEVSTDLVDLVFDCFDGLETMVEDIADTDATDFEIGALLDKLEEHIKKGDSKKDKKKEEKKPEKKEEKNEPALSVDEKTEGKILDQINSGKNAFKLNITLDKECKMKSIRSFLLLKKLRDIGDITYSEPDIKKIEDGEFDSGFQLVFLTDGNGEAVQNEVNSVSEIETKIITPITIKEDKLSLKDPLKEKEPPSEEKDELEEAKNEDKKKTSKKEENKNQTKKTDNKKPSKKRSQSIRVDMDQLDDFMNLIGELVISKGRLGQIAIDHKIDELQETVNTFDRLTTELQDKIMNIRMIPMSHIFNRFPRMIRDISKSSGKKVNLNIVGEGIELDRTILDEIGDPLVHLLRNSVDHGIEIPEERKAKGKPEKGRVDLIADRKRNHVLIEVRDDGKGIDPDVMRETAVKKGLKTKQEVDSLSDKEALNLLWLPGLSSTEKITNVSGRGVGMDVVKSTIEKLNGAVEFTSEQDKGSIFSLKLPLTMAIFKSLFVGIRDETYAIPISNIIETVKLSKKDINYIKGNKTTVLRNEVLPLLHLNSLLNLPEKTKEKDELFAVIVQKEDKKCGLIVDRLIGQQEITIKNAGASMKKTKGIAGVTITGDGRVILVLDLNTLIS